MRALFVDGRCQSRIENAIAFRRGTGRGEKQGEERDGEGRVWLPIDSLE
jgi:hypothetical protein